MALDNAAGAILVNIGGYMVTPISQRFRYLTHCKKNVEMLRLQTPNLDVKRDGVQRAVDLARRRGEEIKPDVQNWLTDVEMIMGDAEKFISEIIANKRYLKWWHPNFRLRYKLSKEARRISYIVMGLQGGGIAENTPPSCIKVMPPVVPASVDSMSVSLPAPPPGIEFMSTKDFVAFESTKTTLDHIFEALKDEKCNMVGLYGMGGVGKTALAKELGKKVKEQNLFDQVVIAVVSQNQLIKHIQGQLADMLGLTFSEETELGRAGRLYARLKNEKKVLIILDDIWASLDLKAVGIPHGVEHEGCKIILTTRRENVCTVMGNQTKKIRVNALPEDEAWDLFRRQVGLDIDSNPLNVPAKDVVRKCKGLPIALVTVGRALREKTLEEWNAAVQQLKKSKGENIEGMDRDVFCCIRLSYDYLQDEEAKLCFLLCCLFPEDYNIPIECLARYAKGKGLIKDVDTMEEARSQVHTIIKNLKASCMLLDSDEQGCVKLHDIVRDVAKSIASGGNHDLFLVKAGVGLKVWPEQETFESYTGVSLMMNDLQELPHGLNCPNLQILLMGKNESFAAIPEAFFERMGMLKVLDLSERTLLLPQSLKFLTNLRTLNLDGCNLGNIYVLGILKKLEILSLFESDISELPKEIGELINLRVLDLTCCRFLRRIPPNVISQLTRLEELYMGASFQRWEVEGTSEGRSIASFSKMKLLPHLTSDRFKLDSTSEEFSGSSWDWEPLSRVQRWEVEGTSEEKRSSASLSELKLLPHLTILCVVIDQVACFPDKFLLPNLLKFHLTVSTESTENYYPKSRSLILGDIEAPLSDIVKTIVLLKMVEELTLSDKNWRCSNILLGIDEGELNGLKSLKLYYCAWIESLIKTNQEEPVILLPDLEILHLSYLKNMEVMCHGLIPNGSFAKLRVLEINDCPELKVILPANLVHRLKNLEDLTVQRCEKLELIFELNEVVDEEEHAMVLSSLRELKLLHLPELFSIRNRSGLFVSLCNLTVLDISNCETLSNVFSLSLAQSLLNLESLQIEKCENLKTIVAEDQGTVSNNCIIQPVIFPKLKLIQVSDCYRLTSLFTIATARGLVKLKEVRLWWNDQLLEIVSHGRKREEEGDEKEILLPQLNRLQLWKMPRLERLCPGSFQMHLPSLKELFVEYCPMLENFAADATVYGLKSASNLVEVRVEEQTLYGAAIQNHLFGKQ